MSTKDILAMAPAKRRLPPRAAPAAKAALRNLSLNQSLKKKL